MEKPIGYLNGELVGTVGFGGIALNSGGVIFYTGTEDNKSYAIEKSTGEIYGVMKWKLAVQHHQ